MKYDPRFRRTKIVATVGPASGEEGTLRELIQAGVDVVRVNSSHGTAASRVELMGRIRKLRKEVDRPIGILVDLQGPRIRVGLLPEPRDLVEGTEVTFAPPFSLRVSQDSDHYPPGLGEKPALVCFAGL